jgi:hypothetical protein
VKFGMHRRTTSELPPGNLFWTSIANRGYERRVELQCNLDRGIVRAKTNRPTHGLLFRCAFPKHHCSLSQRQTLAVELRTAASKAACATVTLKLAAMTMHK